MPPPPSPAPPIPFCSATGCIGQPDGRGRAGRRVGGWVGGCQQGSFRDLTPFLTLPDIPPQSGRSHSVPRTRPSILPDFRKFDFAHWKKNTHTKTNKHILRDVISTPRQQTNNKQTTNTHEATTKGKTRSKDRREREKMQTHKAKRRQKKE